MQSEALGAAITNPSEDTIATALALRGEEQLELFRLAREFKDERVYVRASIEPSNYCRQNCLYCGNRRDNQSLNRFRIVGQELSCLTDAALAIPEVDFVHYSMGEDLNYPFNDLCEEIRKVYSSGKHSTLVLGDLPDPQLKDLFQSASGAPIRYTIKIESGDKDHFKEIKNGYEFDVRLSALQRACKIGFQPCSGVIVGLPSQSLHMIARDLLFLKDYPGLANVSASAFSPSPNSPYGCFSKGDENVAFNFLALMRIFRKDRTLTIPASSSFGDAGMETALKYFANLVSLHLLPAEYRDKYLIYGGSSRSFNELKKVSSLVKQLSLDFNCCRWNP